VPDLRTVAQFVDASFAERRFDPFSTLVRITGVDGEGFDLGLLDLEGHNVTDALLGMSAPDDCWAVGVVTGAWAAPMGSHLRPSAHPDAVRVRLTVMVDRLGDVVALSDFADGRDAPEPPLEGPTVDALRRSLGLATPPPDAPPSQLFIELWLLQVVEEGRALRSAGKRLTWPRATRLHFAVDMLEESGTRTRPDLFVRYVEALGNVVSWSDVRRGISEHGWLADAMPRGAAEWMDDGMLCRWLLGGLPPVSQSITEARRVLAPSAMERFDDALAALLPAAADRPESIRAPDDGPRSA
jgi:hypothetical protein